MADFHGRIARPQARAGQARVEARPYLTVTANGDVAEIVIDGYIGSDIDWWTGEEEGNTARQLRDQIAGMANVRTVNIRVNSMGGDAMEGAAIYAVLSAWPARKIVTIEGVAASAASVIAMAGDEVRMHASSLLMIHDPATFAYGDEATIRRALEMLAGVKRAMIQAYRAKNESMSEEDISAAMTAETWYTGDEAAEAGFVDVVIDGEPATASGYLDPLGRPVAFRNAPAAVTAMIEAAAAEAAAGDTQNTPEGGADDAAEGRDGSEAAEASADDPAAVETTDTGSESNAAPAPATTLADTVAALAAQVAAIAARLDAQPADRVEGDPSPAPAPTARVDAAPPGAGDQAAWDRLRAFAKGHGVIDSFDSARGAGATLDQVRALVMAAAEARASVVDGSTSPAGEAGPGQPKHVVLNHDRAYDYYAHLNAAREPSRS